MFWPKEFIFVTMIAFSVYAKNDKLVIGYPFSFLMRVFIFGKMVAYGV